MVCWEMGSKDWRTLHAHERCSAEAKRAKDPVTAKTGNSLKPSLEGCTQVRDSESDVNLGPEDMCIIRFGLMAAFLVFSPQAFAENLSFADPQSRWEKSWLDHLYGREFIETTDQNIDWSSPPFVVATTDLDGVPGNPGLFVYWTHRMFCGAQNCAYEVWYFDPQSQDYRKVLEGLSSAAITVGPDSYNGMKDIWNGNRRYRWNGSGYQD